MVRWARKRAGMTQHDLAQAAGLPQPSVARIERGRVTPRTSTLIALLRATGHELSVEALIGAAVDREDVRGRMQPPGPARTWAAMRKRESLRILRRLRLFGVRFVLIGDLAEVAHGVPASIGSSIQVAHAHDAESLERLTNALNDLGASPAASTEFLGRHEPMLFETGAGRLELAPGYDLLAPNAERKMIDTGLLVRVAALNDLIQMRRAGGRAEDHERLQLLGALRDELDDEAR